MEAMPCPACGGDEERRLSCDFCGRRGYVPDGSEPLPLRWGLILKVAGAILVVLAVVYVSFLFPRDRDMELLRDGLRKRELIAVKDIDIVKDERGDWSFGIVTTEGGERYPVAARWIVDRTGDKRDKFRVEWLLGTDEARVEAIEELKAKKK